MPCSGEGRSAGEWSATLAANAPPFAGAQGPFAARPFSCESRSPGASDAMLAAGSSCFRRSTAFVRIRRAVTGRGEACWICARTDPVAQLRAGETAGAPRVPRGLRGFAGVSVYRREHLAHFRGRVGPAGGTGSLWRTPRAMPFWARAWKPGAGMVELTLRQGSNPEGPGAPAVRTIATRVHRVVPSRRVSASRQEPRATAGLVAERGRNVKDVLGMFGRVGCHLMVDCCRCAGPTHCASSPSQMGRGTIRAADGGGEWRSARPS